MLAADDSADIVFEVELATGNRSILSAAGATPALSNVRDAVMDSSGTDLMVANRMSGGIVLADGTRWALGDRVSTPISFYSGGISSAPDDRIWIFGNLVNNLSALWAIDVGADVSTLVSDATDNGPRLLTVNGLYGETGSEILYTVAGEYNAVFAIDTVTGERVIISH